MSGFLLLFWAPLNALVIPYIYNMGVNGKAEISATIQDP